MTNKTNPSVSIIEWTKDMPKIDWSNHKDIICSASVTGCRLNAKTATLYEGDARKPVEVVFLWHLDLLSLDRAIQKETRAGRLQQQKATFIICPTETVISDCILLPDDGDVPFRMKWDESCGLISSKVDLAVMEKLWQVSSVYIYVLASFIVVEGDETFERALQLLLQSIAMKTARPTAKGFTKRKPK